MYSLIHQAMDLRKKNPPHAGEYLLIDALLESDFSTEVQLADALLYLVAGFHTTGLCMYPQSIQYYHILFLKKELCVMKFRLNEIIIKN